MEEKHDSIVVIQQRETELSIGGDSQPTELGAPHGCSDLDGGRGRWTTAVLQFIAALWLIPVAILLYLNISGHIIGASAWCPQGRCYLDAFNPITGLVLKTMQKFSKQDRELLGALQYVAKALEVWFSIVATCLVYLVTMRIAGHNDGLPIGLLTRPFEYSDIVSLIDPLLWITGPAPWNSKNSSRDRRLGAKVVALIALSVFLCVLSNLMGPATAVLVIPSLQWITTEKIGDRVFSHLESTQPPKTSGFFWGATPNCGDYDFQTLDFSCSQYPFGDEMDTWMISSIAMGFSGNGFTTQDGLVFQYNTSYETTGTAYEDDFTYRDVTYWTPQRQMMSLFSNDQYMVESIAQGFNESETDYEGISYWLQSNPYSSFVEYNTSLELTIERNGVILGSYVHLWAPYPGTAGSWTVDVDDDRQVKCYSSYMSPWWLYSDGGGTNYTKCIRLGSGWNPGNQKQSFSIQGLWDNDTQALGPGADVTIYSSDRAAFLQDGVLPHWLPATCLTAGPLSNGTECDWERMFEIDASTPLANRSENINTIEFHSIIEPFGPVEFVVDFNAFWSFTEFSFIPSIYENPAQVVMPQSLPHVGTSLAIDPTWILAAWSASPNGTLLPNRASTATVLSCLSLLTNADDGFLLSNLGQGQDLLESLAIVQTMQTLSIIDQTTNVTADASSLPHDPAHPLIQRWAQIYVWAYILNSQTAILGAVVAILGCLVVIVEVIMGLQDKRRFRSPTQLLVAALEHAPSQEFRDRYEDRVMARTRFQVRDFEQSAGKFYFGPPRDDGGRSGECV